MILDCFFLSMMNATRKQRMTTTMKMMRMITAVKKTSFGNDGTQRSTAGSYATLLNELMQKEIMAETTHVSSTMILTSVTEKSGYLDEGSMEDIIRSTFNMANMIMCSIQMTMVTRLLM